MKKIIILFSALLLTLSCFCQQTVGYFMQAPGEEDGYVLFSPEFDSSTYLIDKCGYLVHTWTSKYVSSRNVDLLPDGSLLRPRSGAVIEKLDWNSKVIWSYTVKDDSDYESHEAHQMPNGNILVLVWETKSAAEAISMGLDPSLLQGAVSLITTKIIELKPIGADSADIVWQWNSWDHMIQDYDLTKPNYGIVADHPELININYITTKPDAGNNMELLHSNAVAYNAALNQVMVSHRYFSEFWIIDHSTTTAEAATHKGGMHNKGGDLMYRWGNDTAYDRGTSKDERLYGPHNPHWIDSGYPGAGNIIIFNNGYRRPGKKYSEIDIVAPPVDSNGNYSYSKPLTYGPDNPYWIDTVPGFFSYAIGGVQRLRNGNVLICDGESGAFYEVDTNMNMVWKYVSPVSDTGIVSQGTVPDSNNVFRCTLYEPTYSGLVGQNLAPGKPIEHNPLNYTCSMTTGSTPEPSTNARINAVNPFNNIITLFSSSEINNLVITLFNTMGEEMDKWSNMSLKSGGEIMLDTKGKLSSGIYFIQLNNGKINTTLKLVNIGNN